jgi:ABC-type nitrate/sulfonate/bicarbonate transport system substrate-binding protein
MFRLAKALAFAGAGLLALGASARAADKIDVNLAVPTTSLTFAPLYIAENAGFFAKEGLSVHVRQLVGVASVNALIGGSVDFAVPTATTTLRAASKGQKLLMIAQLVDKPMVEIVLRKDVAKAAGVTGKSSLADKGKAMKGKTIAIQGVGSVVDAIVRVVARKGGLTPDKDMKIPPMSPPAMYPALKAGQIDGYATSLPWTTQSVLAGDAIDLVSGPEGGLPDYLPFAYVVLATRAQFCEEKPDVCRKMVAAFRAANKLIKSDPEKALGYLRKTFSRMDPKLLETAWKDAAAAQADDIAVPKKGVENARQFDIDAGLSTEAQAVKDVTPYFTDKYLK